MSSLANTWTIATKALRRNKLQSSLTMLGMAVGVATVLAMMALGTGAQRAIQDQVRAAGMNMLLVTAGNFQAQREAPPADAIEMGHLEPSPLWTGQKATLRRAALLPSLKTTPSPSTITLPHASVSRRLRGWTRLSRDPQHR